MKEKNEIAIIGLGKIGGNLARNALEKGLKVVGADKQGVSDDLIEAGIAPVDEIKDLKNKLSSSPRLIFLYVPAGEAVDFVLEQLLNHVVEPGDVIVDGGNSYWKDSRARYISLKKKNISFVDMGTSGGLPGARYGACFMAGGDSKAFQLIEPILKKLSTQKGYAYTGASGTGHYVKLVHNGIEFGMMQAIGEGLDMLYHSDEEIHIEETLEVWRHGSVIRSWLIELLGESFKEGNRLKNVPGYVEDTGEVNWLIEDAARKQVPVPVIAQSVWQLINSRDDQKVWAKAIAAMRHGFGDHPYGKDANVASSRSHNRMKTKREEGRQNLL